MGVVSSPAIAGCSTARSIVRSGPPHFEEVSISGPEEATVGEPVTLTVSAKNVGGEPGDFTSTLTAGEDPFSIQKNMRIEDVPVGETKSKDLEVGKSPSVGSLQFRITDYGAKYILNTVPAELSPGDSFSKVDGDLTISVDDVSFETALFYEEDGEKRLYAPGDSSIFAIFRLSVDNEGENDRSTYLDRINFGGGELVPRIGYGTGLDAFVGLDGEPLSMDSLDAFSAEDGWVPVVMERFRVDDGFDVAWNHGGFDEEPEVIWSFPSQGESLEVPEFTTEVQAPQQVEIGATDTAYLSVENTGPNPSTFRGAVQRRNKGADEWEQLLLADVDLEPDDSELIPFEIQEPALGPSDYRPYPGGPVQEVDFVPAEFQFGETYDSPWGNSYTIEEPRSEVILSYESYGENERVRPSNGEFLVATIRATQSGNRSLIDSDSFAAVSEGERYEMYSPETFPVDYVNPVSGREYSGTTWRDADRQLLVFDVPDPSRAAIKMEHSRSSNRVKCFWNR